MQQIEELCVAAVENSQINRIFDDEDVLEFYQNLLNSVTGRECSGESASAVKEMLGTVLPIKSETSEDAWPF